MSKTTNQLDKADQTLKITNTLSNKKEVFIPIDQNKVSMYICGITPYSSSHIGHGRCYVTFDLLYRLLSFLGYEVTYCRNFTDIDDKLLHRAQAELGDKLLYRSIADKYIKEYHENMNDLNCISPTYEPRVTDHIPEIIAFIQNLIDQNKAYVINDDINNNRENSATANGDINNSNIGSDVYFHIASFPEYGKLSKHNVKDLKAGSRVDIDTKKRDPLDFALWKGEKEGTFWQSPWGYGRPGWHIECSALALHYLGKEIDIHGGGLDLVFPHHENEVAQSESLLGHIFARYWMHNGFVCINAEKMSKSLGNFFTLDTIFVKFSPMLIRFYFLNHNYRSPIDFSVEHVEIVQKSYQKLSKLFADIIKKNIKNNNLENSHHSLSMPIFTHVKNSWLAYPLITEMLNFLLDDMNTVGMFGILFEQVHRLTDNQKNNDLSELIVLHDFLSTVLGLAFDPIEEKIIELTPEIQYLINEREHARTNKEWERADSIRDQLHSLGWIAHDKKLN